MTQNAQRHRVGEHPRSATEREWELFVREAEDEALEHVGSVTAPSAEIAHEQASKLFGWIAEDVWVCPASEVVRFATHDLDEDAEPVAVPGGSADGGDRE